MGRGCQLTSKPCGCPWVQNSQHEGVSTSDKPTGIPVKEPAPHILIRTAPFGPSFSTCTITMLCEQPSVPNYVQTTFTAG